MNVVEYCAACSGVSARVACSSLVVVVVVVVVVAVVVVDVVVVLLNGDDNGLLGSLRRIASASLYLGAVSASSILFKCSNCSIMIRRRAETMHRRYFAPIAGALYVEKTREWRTGVCVVQRGACREAADLL